MSLGKEHPFGQYMFTYPWGKNTQSVRIYQQITLVINITPFDGKLNLAVLNKYYEAMRGLVLSFGIKLTGLFTNQNKTIDN